MEILQPPGWARAKGFSNGIAASGTLVFIAGQIGWTGECKWEARDFAGQFRQALEEHPCGPERGERQTRAHRAADLVRARQKRVSRRRWKKSVQRIGS